ncbi:hypothetical protein [Pseudomonas sp. DCA-1]|uniref:hypothetical protein n=1 Tax=Pseudomonas sp. DCA-1 TaxID=3344874 RepID=UPI003977BA24
MKDPFKVFLFIPAIPMLWGGMQLHLQYMGWMPQGSLKSTAWLVVFSLVATLLVAWVLKKSSSQQRLTLEMKLNSVETAGGEAFTGAFSSSTRFLADLEEFQKVVQAVACRESRTGGRFMAWREPATVRIWPGPLGITEIELEVVTRALAEEFISLEVEVMRTTEPDHVGSTAQA